MNRRARVCGGLCALTAGLYLLSLRPADADLRAQPGPKKIREEEEEEPEKTRVPKKVQEIDPKGAPAAPPRQPPPQGKFDIAREAARAKSQQAKDLLRRVSIPYDTLVSGAGKRYAIELRPELRLPEGRFSYKELNGSLTESKDKELASTAGFSLQPFEEYVIEEVDFFLKRKLEGIRRDDAEELAVQVLQETRRLHALLVEQGKRVGPEWKAVDDQLRRRIVKLRRDQLEGAIKANNWRKADELSVELSTYAEDEGVQRDIYRLLLQKALNSLDPKSHEHFVQLRDAVNQFENIAGGGTDDVAKTARRRLADKAQEYVSAAKEAADDNRTAEAFNLLKNADALDPDLPTIRQLRGRLRDRVLYVGVPSLPTNLSPATARTDAERWAADLLFEGLLQVVPDAELGRRYKPALAASMPAMVPLGREFTLMRNARWAHEGGKSVNAHDVYGTLELLRKLPQLPCAEGLDVIDTDKVRIDDPYRLKLGFRQGVLEPLNRATFKVLPAGHLKAQRKGADDPVFAAKPFGSGPYRYDGREAEGPDREAAVFRANPYYGQRAGKLGLPNIREIRFVVPNLSTAPRDIANGQLHLVLDVPTGDLPRYLNDPASTGFAKAWTPGINRRVWMLAVNHTDAALQNVDLRRGISAAIDREAILDAYFRADQRTHHRALVGPFPPNCWATPEKARKPESALYQKTLAGGLLESAAGGRKVKLTLKYPSDDQRAAQACGRIKSMVEDASKKSPEDAPLVEIVPTPVEPEQFHGKLGNGLEYQLAYCPYDYRDDLYWLGGLLDRSAAGRGGRNFLFYLAEGSNPQPDDNDLRLLLDEVRSHRNFRDKVREKTWEAHEKFLARMPFVPLWQLDRHMVVRNGLEISFDSLLQKANDKNPAQTVTEKLIDGSAPFTGVETWRLK